MTYEEFRRRFPAARHFQTYTSEARANHAASRRVGHRQREAFGEFYYTHADCPGVAFDTARAATTRAYELFTSANNGENEAMTKKKTTAAAEKAAREQKTKTPAKKSGAKKQTAPVAEIPPAVAEVAGIAQTPAPVVETNGNGKSQKTRYREFTAAMTDRHLAALGFNDWVEMGEPDAETFINNAAAPNGGKKGAKKSAATKTTTATKTKRARAPKKDDEDRVCAKKGCAVKESETLARNANYSFRRGLCIDHYREALKTERAKK